MKFKPEFLKHLIGLSVTLCIGLFISNGSTLAYEFEGWDRGALGYEVSMMYAEDNNKPLIIYFHKGSEEWSEKLNDEYLSDPEVEALINDIPKAEVNPETGEDEKAIAAEYKVENYPTVFVSMPVSTAKPQEIKPFAKDNNMTTDDFFKSIQGAIIYLYNETALESFDKEEYSDALRFLEMALEYDPERAYSYYALGVIYHTLGIQNKNTDQIELAEDNYVRALDLDPEHEKAKEQLNRKSSYF